MGSGRESLPVTHHIGLATVFGHKRYFKWGIIRGRKIDEEVMIRWRCIMRNRMFGSFWHYLVFSFGPEGDEEVYVAVDERNEALVDVEIYAC